MIIRVHNNNDSDYIDYEAETIEEIREMAKQVISLVNWSNGWSEIIKP